jgi:uncharacterized SAM-binding protein YcdF (DUF218 family)
MLDSLLRSTLQLLEPVGLVWIGLIVLVLVLYRRHQRVPFALAAGLLLVVTGIGGTDLAARLLERLEQQWAGMRIEDRPACDAVVVLGGGAESSTNEMGGVRLTKAGDRIMTGLELMRLGKAPVLVLSGGFVVMKGAVKVESDLIKARLALWNPPPSWELISLGAATDTHDEAVRLLPIARKRGWKRILLVTSASHMRRALAAFRAAGLDSVPAPCNFLAAGSAARTGLQIGIPGCGGFERFGIWLHEIAGWEVYRRRGWLDVSAPGVAAD